MINYNIFYNLYYKIVFILYASPETPRDATQHTAKILIT